MSKQDRQGVRTPADVERKYNLGNLEKETKQESEKLKQLIQTFSQFTVNTNAKFNELESKLNDFYNAYPVGSIYTSLNNNNPKLLFGGEWELLAEGHLLVGLENEELPQLLQTDGKCYLWKRTA